jgi:solute carrier family 25 (mitochondrial carnitine/acylcarnitine transporter), member 20/29
MKANPLVRMFKDFTAGFVSGAISTYAGYPLDTIKVRMQISNISTSVSKTMLNIVRNEGFNGLFKGVLSPVLGNAPVNAVLFAANDLSMRVMKDWNMSQENKVFWSG